MDAHTGNRSGAVLQTEGCEDEANEGREGGDQEQMDQQYDTYAAYLHVDTNTPVTSNSGIKPQWTCGYVNP